MERDFQKIIHIINTGKKSINSEHSYAVIVTKPGVLHLLNLGKREILKRIFLKKSVSHE